MTYELDVIVSWAKRRGIVYPGSEIYWGLANAWDLGPYWAQIRKNIIDLWWKTFVQDRADIVGLDAQILMNPKVWEASGHVGWFSDPLIDCKACKNRFRADKIIEEYLFKLEIQESKNPISENAVHESWPESIILARLKEKLWVDNLVPESWSTSKQKEFLDIYDIKCKSCGKRDWTEPKAFNLMFKTQQGIVEWKWSDVYLRPETAQWIFVNFKNIVDTMRVRVPFGIAQIGKAFRNEITPWNFLFRLREFEQMEIEYFIEPWTQDHWMDHWKQQSRIWREQILWINKENMRFRDHEKDELSFYSTGTTDVEYKFPWWRGELSAAWASRTDYDLRNHMKHSSVDLQYTDPKTWKRYVPYVVEPSFGLTRSIITVLLDAYDEENYIDWTGREQTRVVARFNKDVAPVKFAIFPLMEKDDKMIAISEEIFNKLKKNYMCELDIRWNIGKRYRRQDELGTPYCITVDHQTLEDGTVTVRERDSMEQKRVKIEDIEF